MPDKPEDIRIDINLSGFVGNLGDLMQAMQQAMQEAQRRAETMGIHGAAAFQQAVQEAQRQAETMGAQGWKFEQNSDDGSFHFSFSTSTVQDAINNMGGIGGMGDMGSGGKGGPPPYHNVRGSTTVRSSVRGGTTTTVRSSATATSSTSTARGSAGEPQVREPLVDVFDEGEQIVVVAELPGVQMADIRIQINTDVLALETTGERRYEKEILLPAAVDPTTIQQTYRNGILELRLVRLDQA